MPTACDKVKDYQLNSEVTILSVYKRNNAISNIGWTLKSHFFMGSLWGSCHDTVLLYVVGEQQAKQGVAILSIEV